MKEKINQKIICTVIFAIMFLFLLMQFHQVMVYFDDYGYYSLSYGMETAAGGHEFDFKELVSFLKVHYFEVNGRIPGYLLWLSLYIIGGLTLVQVAAAVFVTLILIAIWKFIDHQEYRALSALLVCAFYGLISLNMHRQGTYWFAAFFQYVVPVLFIVLFVTLYFKYRENGFRGVHLIILALLAFFSAYSQEQLSVTVTFMMCLILGYEIMNRKARIHNLIFVAIAALGVAALLLSPSSQNRAAGSGYSFLETIIYSTYKTIRAFFAADISLLVILLHIALLIYSLELFKHDKHIFKLMDLAGIVLAVISICIYVCRPILSALAQITLNRYYLLIVAGVPCVAVIAIQIIRYYWMKREDSRLLVFMTAVGSVGCLCFVPEVPARLFISSWLLLFPLLADGLFTFAVYLKEKRGTGGAKAFYLLCAIIVVISSANLIHIYCGYASNGKAYRYNDKQLSAAAESEKIGNLQDKVFLKSLPDPECAAALIYHEEVTYMKHWIKIYYDFDSDPAFYFNETGIQDEQLDSYIDQGNQVFIKSN